MITRSALRRPGAWRAAAALVLLAALAGCAMPRPEAIPAFRQGVATAAQQTESTFTAVNAMLRRQQLDRAAHQPTLSEDLFAEGIAAEDRARWMRAFRVMEEYAGKLERLLSPEQRAGVEKELAALGDKVSGLGEEPLPAEIGAGFVRLGGLLVQIKAGQDALEAMRHADPAIQEIFSAMAEAVGATQEDGVRGTMWSAWTLELGKVQVEFLGASGEAAKRRVAEKYLDMLGERDAQDHLLSSLRLSFLSLASAHAQMAGGDRAGAAALIRMVQEEYKAFKEELERLRKQRGAG